MAPVGLSSCVDEAVRLVRLSRAGKQIAFVNRCDGATLVTGDRNRLVQLFVNLLSNACDASQPGDSVEIHCASENEFASIEVVDQGSGIPVELRERVFEPFFTTKQPGEGTGLGLSLVYSIVSDHGGTIAIDGNAGRGTCVRLKLPRAEERNGAVPQRRAR